MILRKTRLRLTEAIYFGEPQSAVGSGFVKQDGSTPLTADWNAGNFRISSQNSLDWFNVKAYGAIGDGSDATVAINAAFAAAIGQGGGTVYFPNGQYLYQASTGLANYPAGAVTHPVWIVGEDMNDTVISVNNISNPEFIRMGTSNASVFQNNGGGVRNICIDARDASMNTKDVITIGGGPGTGGGQYTSVLDVYVLGGRNTINLGEGRYFTIARVNGLFAFGHGVNITAQTYCASYIEDINIANASALNGYGIFWHKTSVTDTGGITIRGCGIGAGFKGGMRFTCDIAQELFVSLDFCTVDNGAYPEDAMAFVNAGTVWITHCWSAISNGTFAAVMLDGCSNINWIGGHLVNLSTGPVVKLNNSCTRISVIGPSINGNSNATAVGVDGTTHTNIELLLDTSSCAAVSNDLTKLVPATSGIGLFGGDVRVAENLSVGDGVNNKSITLNGGGSGAANGTVLIIENAGFALGFFGNPSAFFGGAFDDAMGLAGYHGIRFYTLNLLRATLDSTGKFGLGGVPTREFDLTGTQRFRGIAAPAVSEGNSATLYFDSATNHAKLSENGGAYVNVLGSGGLTGTGVATKLAYWTNATNLTDEPNITLAGTYTLDVNGNVNVGAPGNLKSIYCANQEAFCYDPVTTVSVGVGGAASLVRAGSIGAGSVGVGVNAVSAATGQYSTGVGYGAVKQATGNNNTGIGKGTLETTTTGADNTAFGFAAGVTNTVGANNVLVGSGADVAAPNLSNAVAVGYQAVVAASDSMALGNAAMQVGIRTSTPKHALDVGGAVAVRQTGLILVNGANQNVAITDFSWFRVTGPTAPFSIGGIAGGTGGQLLMLRNTTAFQMTLNNADAGSLAVNRILTPTGGNINCSVATLVYDDTSDLWITQSYF